MSDKQEEQVDDI